MLRPFAISTAFFFMMSNAYTRDMIEVFHADIIEFNQRECKTYDGAHSHLILSIFDKKHVFANAIIPYKVKKIK